MSAPDRQIVLHLPEDIELLAALGRVSIRHGHLDHILKRVIKTLTGLTAAEADAALAFDASSTLRDLVRRIAEKRLGKTAIATLKLKALLNECRRVTERRNALVHNLYARERDGEESMLIGHGGVSPVPTVEELNKLAHAIELVTNQLNAARFPGGFLLAALEQTAGKAAIESARVSED